MSNARRRNMHERIDWAIADAINAVAADRTSAGRDDEARAIIAARRNIELRVREHLLRHFTVRDRVRTARKRKGKTDGTDAGAG